MGIGEALAEREGFEPPDACASAVFKTAALNHSATSPLRGESVRRGSESRLAGGAMAVPDRLI